MIQSRLKKLENTLQASERQAIVCFKNVKDGTTVYNGTVYKDYEAFLETHSQYDRVIVLSWRNVNGSA